MLPIPDEILKPFEAVMEQKPISPALRPHYRKWLRYYLDFRVKYPPPDSKSDQVRLFIEKLRSKNQSQNQLDQAAHAVSIFFEVQSGKRGKGDSQSLSTGKGIAVSSTSHCVPGSPVKEAKSPLDF